MEETIKDLGILVSDRKAVERRRPGRRGKERRRNPESGTNGE